MQVHYKKTSDLIPYVNNPRKNDHVVDFVASSIKNFGFKVPIIVDANNEIVAGHTRLKASQKLGLEEVPVIVADDLTEEQIRAFRIADNKTAEGAEWDKELLALEIEGLDEYDFQEFGFSQKELDKIFEDGQEDLVYTDKVVLPDYTPKKDSPPPVESLADTSKAEELLREVRASGVEGELLEFLELASYRFTEFDFQEIAEYYSHADPEVQEIFEKLALVIIDFNQAIEAGFIEFIGELMQADDE